MSAPVLKAVIVALSEEDGCVVHLSRLSSPPPSGPSKFIDPAIALTDGARGAGGGMGCDASRFLLGTPSGGAIPAVEYPSLCIVTIRLPCKASCLELCRVSLPPGIVDSFARSVVPDSNARRPKMETEG